MKRFQYPRHPSFVGPPTTHDASPAEVHEEYQNQAVSSSSTVATFSPAGAQGSVIVLAAVFKPPAPPSTGPGGILDMCPGNHLFWGAS